MNDPRLTRKPDGTLVLESLAPWFLASLAELPELLAPDQPDDVKGRLFPDPSADAEQQEEWKRLVVPELFALIASARRIVAQDLKALEPATQDVPPAWRLPIPGEHLKAWISALNAGRLTLSERHGIGEREMSGDVEDLPTERRLAMVKIHLLGWIEELLVQQAMPGEGGGEGDQEEQESG
ncbi:MAG: DUF2017 family protein [Planctomycetaceae bacterium]